MTLFGKTNESGFPVDWTQQSVISLAGQRRIDATPATGPDLHITVINRFGGVRITEPGPAGVASASRVCAIIIPRSPRQNDGGEKGRGGRGPWAGNIVAASPALPDTGFLATRLSRC
jgi:hypothetical protein